MYMYERVDIFDFITHVKLSIQVNKHTCTHYHINAFYPRNGQAGSFSTANPLGTTRLPPLLRGHDANAGDGTLLRDPVILGGIRVEAWCLRALNGECPFDEAPPAVAALVGIIDEPFRLATRVLLAVDLQDALYGVHLIDVLVQGDADNEPRHDVDVCM